MPLHTRMISAATLALLAAGALPAASEDPAAWPQVSRQTRPWSYWWWMGSAVNPADLTREMETLRKAGWGGVHIIPIYGAKGYESQYIEYLSPKWMDMLRHTVTEGQRLDMGVDMSTGTGWCFGGPTITPELASVAVQAKAIETGAGQPPRYEVSVRPSARVKRAAPGGAGYMLNPFYGKALETFLEPFTRAFAAYQGPLPRAVYHDSFEYGANWAPNLLDEFARRRGYRLQDEYAALFGSLGDRTARVKADYRATLEELALEQFTRPWVEWAHARGFITRNEAHGGPANLLDLYAVADIPETEMFNRDRSTLVSKFASSAAHVAGRPLTSCETGTWLKEHFNETLADLKDLLDQLFVAGVNHVIYHGTCYSPASAPWPGWLFYASTQMNSRNAIWRDVPALNQYITRAQSLLQHGRPDNDLLLYWPLADVWHNPAGMTINLTVHVRGWIEDQQFGRLAATLFERGYAFDYISDRQLQAAQADTAATRVAGGAYRAILVPRTEHMPVETMARLIELARAGAVVVFEEKLPADVPGLGRLEERRAALAKLNASLTFSSPAQEYSEARVGKGRILVGAAIGPALRAAGVRCEALTGREGLSFIRRASASGPFYFLANRGAKAIDGWIPLAARARSAVLLDAMTGRTGAAALRASGDACEVYVQLDPGASIFVRLSGSAVTAPAWTYRAPGGRRIPLEGTWSVKFIEGGPELPADYRTGRLDPWTANGGAAENFAGTARYTLRFDAPAPAGQEWWLELGRVAESARVRLNGRDLGTVFMAPYRVLTGPLAAGSCLLEVEVTNLSANRIRDLDRRRVAWRVFHDINFVNLDYKPFDASAWPVRDSGLMGPVALRAAVRLRPEAALGQ